MVKIGSMRWRVQFYRICTDYYKIEALWIRLVNHITGGVGGLKYMFLSNRGQNNLNSEGEEAGRKNGGEKPSRKEDVQS